MAAEPQETSVYAAPPPQQHHAQHNFGGPASSTAAPTLTARTATTMNPPAPAPQHHAVAAAVTAGVSTSNSRSSPPPPPTYHHNVATTAATAHPHLETVASAAHHNVHHPPPQQAHPRYHHHHAAPHRQHNPSMVTTSLDNSNPPSVAAMAAAATSAMMAAARQQASSGHQGADSANNTLAPRSSSFTNVAPMLSMQPEEWKLRDAAESVVRKRENLVHPYAKDLWLAAEFNIIACFQDLRREKRQVIQWTFTTAAQSLLETVQKQNQRARDKMSNNIQHVGDSDDDEDEIDDGDTSFMADLPAALQTRQELQQLRHTCLVRGLENKEMAKKKGPRGSTASASGATNKTSAGEAIVAGPASGIGAPAAATTTTTKAPRKRKSDAAGGAAAPHRKNAAANKAAAPSSTKQSAVLSSMNGNSTVGLDHDASNGGALAALANAASAAVPQTTLSSSTSSDTGPKFTRNTPASSAAALDFRFTNSRAILCAAGNITFSEITPDFVVNGVTQTLDATVVPQKIDNMGAVVVDARVYGRRTIAVVHNCVRRQRLRYHFSKNGHEYVYDGSHQRDQQHHSSKDYLQIPNPFAYRAIENNTNAIMDPWKDLNFDDDQVIPHNPNPRALTEAWTSLCLPRLQSIVNTGAGHALYHDVQWTTRHGRIADFLKSLTTMNHHTANDTSTDNINMGPHLIVTTSPDVNAFVQEFYDMRGQLRLVLSNPNYSLRVMAYQGSLEERRKLRHYFDQATGLPEAPFHVLVTSYSAFLEDYLHFCQVPWEVVLFDDGASWMAASQGDPNSSLAALWETGIWSSNDHHAGLAGSFEATTTSCNKWDFSFQLTENTPESVIKDAFVGLTARHRIMTASKLFIEQRWSLDLLSVSGIVTFLAPHFASVVREEWDRSNIAKDAASMQHFRNLVARSMVVHHEHAAVEGGDSGLGQDMHKLALAGLDGKLPPPNRSAEGLPPIAIMDDHFVSEEKVTFSRRGCLSWLGLNAAADQSWLRYELGMADFRIILNAMKISSKHGHFCEEITTSSSTTSTGATGQVAGTMAYRLAICCGRHFGSEQGLRQHLSAQHAPPGTWLCRTCGSDCVTSQARTHHERTCGQPTGGAAEQGGSVGATPTVGQGGSKSGVGKKKSQRNSVAQSGNAAAEEKDPDGSFRVPGYRGVWVNKKGKHFVKIDGKRFTDDKPAGDENVVLFDSCDDAARKYDEVVTKQSKKGQKVELNFKPGGTRNIYEDATTSTASGLGGSAANVVPALSVINIKDLPPDVKPLLRDPRQTSRTGGNSKRHVYAYRGVCRQARKGHDRWQSQISFMGVNHYLGTFDSEWDAAAIYAWAHLILYGEEATRQAQKEGEEAAAAYEQEKRDIAAGKIPEPPPKPEKKKKAPKKKTAAEKAADAAKKAGAGDKKDAPASGTKTAPKKRKSKPKDGTSTAADSKRAKTDPKPARQVKEGLNVVLAKAVSKTPILGPRDLLESLSNDELQALASMRIQNARKSSYCLSVVDNCPSPAIESVRCCLPILDSRGIRPVGAAMLMGIPANLSWSLQQFIHANGLENDESMTAIQMLAVEYDDGGVNEGFRSIMQGNVCIIGQANKRLLRHFKDLGGGSAPVGCSIGELDCHIGGVPGSCSARAACIRYTGNEFQLACLNDKDIVTLNGMRITTDMKGVTLLNNDICSVGPRVFVFILPNYV